MMNRRTAIRQTTLILGAALSTGTLAGLMAGCKAEIKLEWEPVLFTNDEVKTLRALTDTILPKTDTPSASDVGVPEYIDDIVGNFWNEKDQEDFRSGLTTVNKWANDQFDRSYNKLTEDQRNHLMDKLVEEAMNHTDGDNRPFFLQLKELTYSGYFTSKIIGEDVLAYDPVPGEYIGDLPVEEAGKAWSL